MNEPSPCAVYFLSSASAAGPLQTFIILPSCVKAPVEEEKSTPGLKMSVIPVSIRKLALTYRTGVFLKDPALQCLFITAPIVIPFGGGDLFSVFVLKVPKQTYLLIHPFPT